MLQYGNICKKIVFCTQLTKYLHSMKKLLLLFVFLFAGAVLTAQTTISGKVTDAKTNEPLPGVSITIQGKSLGTTTDFDGNYTLKVKQNAPFTVEISSIGYKTETADVTKNNQTIDFKLQEVAEALDEVVVSASRTPERIRESPVTIERIDARAIQSASSPDFYDGLENLKGVDINTNSLTFKSINTRGFATFSNTRFVQLVDGIDNTSPALNFVLGNLLGMNELDVNTVEILPGASSALYGANAFNGILFMTSKSPFKHTGISAYYKTGLTIQNAAGDNAYNDVGIRMAYKFSDKFAAKANFSFLKGTDWYATDYAQYSDENVAIGQPNTITPYSERNEGFDAMNIYGDEVATVLDYDAITGMPAGTFGKEKIARTGYMEKDLMDYDAKGIKADFALHYKPWADDKEVIFNFRTGRGNTIYQGANRYSIKDFVMNQMKLEFRGKNFFIRGYRTTEDAGDSYDSRFTAINMNRLFKSDRQWFTDYATGYLGLLTANPIITNIASNFGLNPGNVDDAHTFARMLADNRTPYGPLDPSQPSYALPGTPEFEAAFNEITADPNLTSGSKFVDNSSVHHVDANYNFKDMIDNWADLQLGGSFRRYSLNSSGTIFTDYDAPILYDEYGAYMQITKKFADERLKFTGSARYDKSQNFNGHISPRLAFVYSAGEHKNHNFRISYQTGFRNPTTQDQYIGLDAGRAILVGSAPDNLDRYTSRPIPLSQSSQDALNYFGSGIAPTVTLTGRDAYENAFSLSSFLAFAASAQAGAPDVSLLEQSDLKYVQPEGITSYEVGYRGKISKFNIDLSAYFNQYDGFIATKTVVVPNFGKVSTVIDPASNPEDITDLTPIGLGPTPNAIIAVGNGDFQPFQVYTNSKADISSFGTTLGISTQLFDKFNIGVNYTLAKFQFDQSTDPDYEAGFNTPEHKVKVNLGSDHLIGDLGFNINYRWQTDYLWQSSIADAVVPARSVIDAQISYKVPSFKSIFKVGGTNIGGKEYMVAPGSGFIGSQYYVSWTVNP